MFKRISVAEARKMLTEDSIAIIDIRDPQVYRQGHIDGAQNVSLMQLDEYCQALKTEQKILVCCYHGNSSQMVAQHLAESGFTDVYSLDGGYEAWRHSHE